MKDHPIAAGLWLIATVGGIGFLANMGMKSSAEVRDGEHKAELNKELVLAIDKGRRGEFDEAISMLEALAAKHPNEAGLFLNLGVAQRAADKVDDADKSFARVLELDPTDFDALAERASIRLEKDQLDEAIAMMDKIPTNEGRARQRLRDDPLWAKHSDDERVQALRKKHEVESLDSSLQMQQRKKSKAAQGVAHP